MPLSLRPDPILETAAAQHNSTSCPPKSTVRCEKPPWHSYRDTDPVETRIADAIYRSTSPQNISPLLSRSEKEARGSALRICCDLYRRRHQWYLGTWKAQMGMGW